MIRKRRGEELKKFPAVSHSFSIALDPCQIIQLAIEVFTHVTRGHANLSSKRRCLHKKSAPPTRWLPFHCDVIWKQSLYIYSVLIPGLTSIWMAIGTRCDRSVGLTAKNAIGEVGSRISLPGRYSIISGMAGRLSSSGYRRTNIILLAIACA